MPNCQNAKLAIKHIKNSPNVYLDLWHFGYLDILKNLFFKIIHLLLQMMHLIRQLIQPFFILTNPFMQR